MKRLSVILIAVIMFLAIMLGGTQALAADEVFRWKIQGFNAPGTTFGTYAENLMARIMELSHGRIHIDYYPVDALFPVTEMPNALRDGIVDGVNFYAGLFTGIDEAFSLFNSTPGMFADPMGLIMWLKYGGGLQIWQDMADHYGMNQHILLSCASDGENFLWSNTPIHEIEDMRSLTVRFMPIFGTVLADHGISVVNLSSTEVVPGLERGVIDAGEYSTPSSDLSLGFQDVAKYLIRPGIHQPSGCNAIAIRKDIWNSLPDDIKAVIENACTANFIDSYFEQRIDNVKSMQIIQDAGVEVCLLSAEAQNTMNEWVQEWLESKSATNPWMKKIIDSQKAFIKTYAPYSDSMALPWPKWMLE